MSDVLSDGPGFASDDTQQCVFRRSSRFPESLFFDTKNIYFCTCRPPETVGNARLIFMFKVTETHSRNTLRDTAKREKYPGPDVMVFN